MKVRKAPYTIVKNQAINDDRLSFAALGVLTYLMSKPDGWHVQEHDVCRRGQFGRDKYRRIMGELRDAGYVVKYRTRSEAGQFAYETYITDTPEAPATVDGFSVDGLPVDGSAVDGKPDHLITKDLPIKDLTNKEGEKEAAPPPRPPAHFAAFEAQFTAHPEYRDAITAVCRNHRTQVNAAAIDLQRMGVKPADILGFAKYWRTTNPKFGQPWPSQLVELWDDYQNWTPERADRHKQATLDAFAEFLGAAHD